MISETGDASRDDELVEIARERPQSLEEAVAVIAGLISLIEGGEPPDEDPDPLGLVLGAAFSMARQADAALGFASRVARQIGSGAARVTSPLRGSLLASGGSAVRDRLVSDGRAGAAQGRKQLETAYETIRDALLGYVTDDIAPRLIPPLIDDLTPRLVDETAPQLIEGLMPELKDRYIPEILDSVATSPALIGAIREGSRGAAAETSVALRDHAATADDRVEASFRRLIRRRRKSESDLPAPPTESGGE